MNDNGNDHPGELTIVPHPSNDVMVLEPLSLYFVLLGHTISLLPKLCQHAAPAIFLTLIQVA